MRVDPPKRAAHHVERMDGGLPGVEPRLEQPAFDDVEPPGRIGGGVVGRALAKMAPLAAENGRRHLFHFVSRRSSPRSLRRLYRGLCLDCAVDQALDQHA